MTSLPPFPAVAAGLLAAFVGFTSSFPVILQGLSAVGATPAQAASGLMALSLAMGICAILLSLVTRMPVSVAWSTPGAALLATSALPQGGYPEAVGAFMIAALLVVLAGLWKPLGRLISAIPASLAQAMLGGIVFTLCLAPIRAVAAEPAAGLAIAATWLVVGRLKRLYAVPAAALVAVGIILFKVPPAALHGAGSLLPHPVFVMPEFTLTSAVGIALPLFVVTMASQNIPGLTILRIHGYLPAPRLLFASTGAFSAVAAFFGGHAVNLAAVTATLCAGEDAGRDPARRYWSGTVSGLAYVVFGLGAGLVTAFASLSPLLIQSVAGLALVGALSSAVHGAMAAAEDREAATLCFLITASGTAFFGISAAFWGLVAGGVVLLLTRAAAAASARRAASRRPAEADRTPGGDDAAKVRSA